MTGGSGRSSVPPEGRGRGRPLSPFESPSITPGSMDGGGAASSVGQRFPSRSKLGAGAGGLDPSD